MRVVGGSVGGIPLITPKTNLRPTMELVKNAIFNSLIDFIPDARVLDLFAGSGGLGIEALSRGAATATFVESDRKAVEAIRKNLEKTRLTGEVVPADVFRWLNHSTLEAAFDMILADPPYKKDRDDRDLAAELLTNENLPRLLAPGGIIALEYMPGAQLPLGDLWDCVKQKRYGATEVAYLRRRAEA